MVSKFVVILSLVGIGETLTAGNCPKLVAGSPCGDFKFCPDPGYDDWKCLKNAMNCTEHKGRYYHCARDVNGCYVQHCAKRVYCNPGQQPLLDLTQDTAMCQPCPPDEYQRRPFWSHEQKDCDYAKTKCDGTGEIECHPGSATEDKTCRCNIDQNFALQGYVYNKRTCCSKDYDPECYCVPFKEQCPPGTVRHFTMIFSVGMTTCVLKNASQIYTGSGTLKSVFLGIGNQVLCQVPGSPGVMTEIFNEAEKESSSQNNATSTVKTPLPDSQVSTGVIIALVVTTVILAVAIAVLVYCIKSRWQRSHHTKKETGATEDNSLLQVDKGPSKTDAERVMNEFSNTEARENDRLLQSETVPSARDTERVMTWDEISNEAEDIPGETKKRKRGKDKNAVNGHIYNIKIDAPGSTINFGGENDTRTNYFENVSKGLPDGSQGASSLATDENLVSVNPEESRQEESIMSDETSMDTTPKQPVEHEDIHPDDTRVKEWCPPEVVADDQTKRKEVWSPPEVVANDQTKRKEAWSSPEVVADDQTKKKELWTHESYVEEMKEKEIFLPAESEDSSREDVEETKVKEV